MAFQGFAPLRGGDPREVGRYRLYARLGAGGMGRVYLTLLPGGTAAALKLVRPELAEDPEFRRRFATEAKAAKSVNGLHIAPLVEADTEAETPWLTTAYVAGPSLQEAIRDAGPLPLPSVAALAVGIARALESIHAAGIIHRDLKPANVILTAEGPRVIDFGVARAADSTTARMTGTRVGTPQYMTPEQVSGSAATPALDVFALGLVVYEAVTGRSPFGEGDALAVMLRIKDLEPDLTGCPAELQGMIASCLAKDPAARPTLSRIIEHCQSLNPAPAGPGWLPPAVARDIEARASALAALVAQAQTEPAPPRSTVHLPPPGTTADVVPGSAPAGAPVPPVPPARADRPQRSLKLSTAAIAGAVLVVGVAIGTYSLAGKSSTNGSGPSQSSTTSQVHSSAPAGVPVSQATTAGTPTTTNAGSPPPPPATSSSPDDNAVQFNDTMLLNDIDLDSNPAKEVPSNNNASVWTSADGFHPETTYTIYAGIGEPHLAIWTATSEPTRAQCAYQITTHGVSNGLPVTKGAKFCVQTPAGRIAYLAVGSFETNTNSYEVKVTVWSAISS